MSEIGVSSEMRTHNVGSRRSLKLVDRRSRTFAFRSSSSSVLVRRLESRFDLRRIIRIVRFVACTV